MSTILSAGGMPEVVRATASYGAAGGDLQLHPPNYTFVRVPMAHRLLLAIEGSADGDGLVDVTNVFHCCGEDPAHHVIRSGPWGVGTSVTLIETFDEDCELGIGLQLISTPSVLPSVALTLWYVPIRPRCWRVDAPQLTLQGVSNG